MQTKYAKPRFTGFQNSGKTPFTLNAIILNCELEKTLKLTEYYDFY